MGMGQYLLIPFLVGWTSIYQLFWCSPGVQGFDTHPSKKSDHGSSANPNVLLNRANLNHQQWLILRVAFWWAWVRGVGCTYDIIIKQRQKHPETLLQNWICSLWSLARTWINEVNQIISHPQLGFIVGFTTLSWVWLLKIVLACSAWLWVQVLPQSSLTIGHWARKSCGGFKGINKPSCGVKPLSPENRLCLRSSFGLQFKGRKDSNKRSAPDATCVHCPLLLFVLVPPCPRSPSPCAHLSPREWLNASASRPFQLAQALVVCGICGSCRVGVESPCCSLAKPYRFVAGFKSILFSTIEMWWWSLVTKHIFQVSWNHQPVQLATRWYNV